MPLAHVRGQVADKSTCVTMATKDAPSESQTNNNHNKELGAIIAGGVALNLAVLDAKLEKVTPQAGYQIAGTEMTL